MTTTADNDPSVRGRGVGRRKAGEHTRERLLDTAQGLFALKGIDAVSINEICREAEANSAAVHYHFGSKDALVEEILRRGVQTWGEHRDRLVSTLESRSDVTLRDVVEAMVEPTAALVERPWGLTYVQFLYSVSNHPIYGGLANTTAEAHTQRYVALLERMLPELSRDELLRRYTLTRMFLYQALAIEHGPLSSWLASHGVDLSHSIVPDLLAYFTGGLNAPPLGSTNPHEQSSRPEKELP